MYIIHLCGEYRIYNILNLFQCSPEQYMVGNDIVGFRQMSLLVVVHLLSRCRPSGHQGKQLLVFQTLVNREKNGN